MMHIPRPAMRTRLTVEHLETRLTPSASIVKDIVPGPEGAGGLALRAVGSDLYFISDLPDADANGNDTGVWRTDGTARGTVLLARVSNFFLNYGNGFPDEFTAFAGKVYFVSDNRLWATDGTPAGTAPFTDPALAVNGSSVKVFGGSLYFSTDSALYKTDGTAAGTVMVQPTPTGSGIVQLYQLANGTVIYFTFIADGDLAVYKSDGFGSGYTLLYHEGGGVTALMQVVPTDNIVYFTTGSYLDHFPGGPLVRTDGTVAGTFQLPGASALGPVWHGDLYYRSGNPIDGYGLYKTDGTTAGSVAVKPPPPSGSGDGVSEFTLFRGAIYFTYNDGPGGGDQLWRTNGTAAGTVRVTNSPGAFFERLTVAGAGTPEETLYCQAFGGAFSAPGLSEDFALVRTDGTAAGLRIVRRFHDPAPRQHLFQPLYFTAVGSSLYFVLDSSTVFGSELWHVTAPHKRQIIAVGSGAGPQVRVYDAATGRLKFNLLAAPSNFRGGVHVAAGDVTGDGVEDIITGAGPGGGPAVEVFDGKTGQLIRSFYAYAPAFTGGVFVASADLDLDGFADVVTGPGVGRGPRVEVWSGKTGQLIRSFNAYDPTFAGGVTVAAGDLDGTQDIITGAGRGAAPLVKVFDGLTGAAVGQFTAFDPTFRGGVTVAAADTDADGNADVVVGAGPGYVGGPAVWVVSGLNLGLLRAVLPYDPRFTGGVAVGAADVNSDGRATLVTGPGRGGGPDVRVLGGSAPARRFNAFDPAFLGGVWVG
jgi:ELWxxDGT repeat protein